MDPPGQANMAICSGAVGQRYNALAFTLEMPFKDTNYSREPVRSCLCWLDAGFRISGFQIQHPGFMGCHAVSCAMRFPPCDNARLASGF